jgi:prepilin-type N-terminal cleavage/methylation domain-containing protein
MNSRSKGLFSHEKGFTLIELMVVIAIIGVVMLFVIPNFANIQRRARIKAGAEEVAQDFRQLRERALSQGQDYRVALPLPDVRNYDVISPGGIVSTRKLGGTTGGQLKFGSQSGAVLPGYNPPGVNGFPFPGDTCIFFGRGHATAGAAYITDGKQDFAVEVNNIGKIKVWVYNGTTWK